MASFLFLLQGFVVCFFISSYNKNSVEGGGGTRFMSEKEDIELENQLKLLNKPAIKSIKTKYGDVYDCVDFYKQPAFDHPMLKNHTFHPQMRPSSMPISTRGKNISKADYNRKESKYERVFCPRGTVPIRRITKDDLIREKMHFEKYSSNYSVLTRDHPGTHYAVVRTGKVELYYGVGGHISTFRPPVIDSQYSAGRLKLINGDESIQVGWIVNPTLYGDTNPRLYIYTEIGQTGCFNTRCPGFVIVNTEIPLGTIFEYSVNDDLVYMDSMIYQEAPVANWWLLQGIDKIQIGFWPARIFSHLSVAANIVDWGGEVFSPPNIPSPPMGAGKKTILIGKFVASIVDMTTINGDNKIVPPVELWEYNDVKEYISWDVGYKVKYWLHYAMLYGGHGGVTGN